MSSMNYQRKNKPSRKQFTLEVLRVFLVNEVGKITTVIQNQVEGLAAGEGRKRLLDTPNILLLGFAFPSENGNAGRSNAIYGLSTFELWWIREHSRGCSMVLSREDILYRMDLCKRNCANNRKSIFIRRTTR